MNLSTGSCQSCQTVYRPVRWTLMFMFTCIQKYFNCSHSKKRQIWWHHLITRVVRHRKKDERNMFWQTLPSKLDVYLHGVSNYRETLLGTVEDTCADWFLCCNTQKVKWLNEFFFGVHSQSLVSSGLWSNNYRLQRRCPFIFFSV